MCGSEVKGAGYSLRMEMYFQSSLPSTLFGRRKALPEISLRLQARGGSALSESGIKPLN